MTGIITAGAYGGFHAAAPGSSVEIYGSNLSGTARGWASSDFSEPNAPTSLDRVTVTVAGTAVVSYQGQSSAPSQLTINSLEAGFYAPVNFNVTDRQIAAVPSTSGAFVNGGNVLGFPARSRNPEKR